MFFMSTTLPMINKKVSALLTLIEGKTCHLLGNLMAPDKQSTKPNADITTLLTNHLSRQSHLSL